MKKAMKQALEALEDAKTHGLVYVNEIVDLRQAIAEAEKQEQGVCPKCRSFFCDHTCKQEQGDPVTKLFGTLFVYDTTPPRENT